jgi:hypothetical protein
MEGKREGKVVMALWLRRITGDRKGNEDTGHG